jgi:hypothetical protein
MVASIAPVRESEPTNAQVMQAVQHVQDTVMALASKVAETAADAKDARDLAQTANALAQRALEQSNAALLSTSEVKQAHIDTVEAFKRHVDVVTAAADQMVRSNAAQNDVLSRLDSVATWAQARSARLTKAMTALGVLLAVATGALSALYHAYSTARGH